MNTNEYTYTPRKKSPYADSPYECNWAPPVMEEQPEETVPRSKQTNGSGIKPLVALAVLIACCVGTALGVTAIWQGKIDRMEQAMDEKFAA